MCDLESVQTLQRGMNYKINKIYSVILMSQRKNAPYKDCIAKDGITIEYEGHDLPKTGVDFNPKSVDQPIKTKTGQFTQNGKFVNAVENYLNGKQNVETVRVYEKLLPGIWSDKGFFNLIDYKTVKSNNRRVFRFILREADFEFDTSDLMKKIIRPRTRIIPSEIKKKVWARDKGQCVICGKSDELHFDHDLPYSKGGSSVTVRNVRILCARHNLEKSNKIQ